MSVLYYNADIKSVVFTTKRGKMKEIFEILKKTALFSGIEQKDLASMLDCLSAKTVSYKKTDTIFRQDDKITFVGIIINGSVLISKDDYWGNRTILSKITEGQIFGETYAVSGCPLMVDVTAETDCTVMLLDVNRIMTVCPSACGFHSVLIRNLVTLFSEKNLLLSNKISYISQRRLRDKLLAYLSDCAQKAQDSHFAIPFNRQQLADFLCADRSALSSELCRLRDEGIIEFRKNSFTLKNQ